jgi:hypothetical protein
VEKVKAEAEGGGGSGSEVPADASREGSLVPHVPPSDRAGRLPPTKRSKDRRREIAESFKDLPPSSEEESESSSNEESDVPGSPPWSPTPPPRNRTFHSLPVIAETSRTFGGIHAIRGRSFGTLPMPQDSEAAGSSDED